jgi:hypothetical protein
VVRGFTDVAYRGAGARASGAHIMSTLVHLTCKITHTGANTHAQKNSNHLEHVVRGVTDVAYRGTGAHASGANIIITLVQSTCKLTHTGANTHAQKISNHLEHMLHGGTDVA